MHIVVEDGVRNYGDAVRLLKKRCQENQDGFRIVAASTSTTRCVNTAANRPTVNDTKPSFNVFHKSHSPVRRTFNQRTTPKNSDLKETINTVKVNNVTTAGTKVEVSAVQGNGENVVKSSACWIWRPTRNVIDYISKDSGSYMLKRFNYVDLQGRLKHMTGNKSFLTDYQEIDGGFVAFGGSPKGGIEINAKARKAGQEKASDHEYILLPFMPSSTQSLEDKDAGEVPDKGDDGVSKGSGIDDLDKTDSNTQNVGTVKPSINTASTNINTGCLNINTVSPNDPSMPSLEETDIFDDVYDDIEVGVEAKTNNLELSTVVSPIPTTRFTQTIMLQIFSQRLLMLADLTFWLLALGYLISEDVFDMAKVSTAEPKLVLLVTDGDNTTEGIQFEYNNFFTSRLTVLRLYKLDRRARTLGMKLFKIGSGETEVFDYTTAVEKDVNVVEPVSTTGDSVNVASVILDSSGPFKKVGDEAVYTGEDDRVVRVVTTAASLEADQESGNMNKTQPTATLNEPSPQGTGSSSGPRRHVTTLGDTHAQT
nr:hypothetical protein [Tanacetum cinerariifolium]